MPPWNGWGWKFRNFHEQKKAHLSHKPFACILRYFFYFKLQQRQSTAE
jgi:hypothetical protein